MWLVVCSREGSGPALCKEHRRDQRSGLSQGLWALGDAEAHAGKVRTSHFRVCLTPPASFYEILFTLLLFCGKESKY